MSLAIVAIVANQEDETVPACLKCLGALSDTALRCKNCLAHIHLRCSDLADYQLIRFAVTQAAYVCANCVKTKDMSEEKYEEELSKVKAIIAKEGSIIEQTEDDSKTTSQVDSGETRNDSTMNLS